MSTNHFAGLRYSAEAVVIRSLKEIEVFVNGTGIN